MRCSAGLMRRAAGGGPYLANPTTLYWLCTSKREMFVTVTTLLDGL
jgi:hypothetical protein